MSGAASGRTRLILLGCGLLYTLLAVVGVVADWPTPEKIAKERLQAGLLLANALDKEFRPYDQPRRADVNAQYEALRRDFRGRYGDAFDTRLLDGKYLSAMEHMESNRIKLAAFAGATVLAVFGLLHVVWMVFRGRAGKREAGSARAR